MEKSVVVVGLGYVGLPVVCLGASKGMAISGLDLDQKKWDESSGTFKLKVVAPDLKRIYNDSWVDLLVNLNGQETFEIYSTISKIKVEGSVDEMVATTEDSRIDLTQLDYNELISSKKGDVRKNCPRPLRPGMPSILSAKKNADQPVSNSFQKPGSAVS